jgi:PII-like signaling protein
VKAREMQMGSATVLRGPMGLENPGICTRQKFFGSPMDPPIVVEIVDSEEKVNAFLPVLDPIMRGGLVMVERAKMIRYQDEGKV